MYFVTNLFTVFYLLFILPATVQTYYLTLAGTEDEDIKYDKSKSFQKWQMTLNANVMTS